MNSSEEVPAVPGTTPLWKTLAPWAGAVAVIAYLFFEVPYVEVWEAASRARLDWLVPLMLISVLYWFLLDSLAYSYLVTRFNTPFGWDEARGMRAVTYLVAAINWNVGTAAIVLYLRRFKEIPPMESTSTLLFYMMFDTLILTSFALAGATVFGESPAIQKIQLGAGIVLAVNCLVLAMLAGERPGWAWLGRMRAWSVVRSYRMAHPRDFAVLLMIRIAYFAGFIGVFFIGALSFGVDVPFTLAMASVPAILLAGALPITPAGLGTQAAAMLFFWSAYGDRGAIVALGLVLPVTLTLTRVLLGLPYLAEFRRLRSSQ